MTPEVIFDGTYLFHNALSMEEQKKLVEIYSNSKKNTYTPKLKSGYSMNLDMTCFGKHWSAVDYKYHDTRIDYDNRPVEAIPQSLCNIAKPFSLNCFPEHDPVWDIAIMNFYRRVSALGMHQDNSESKETMGSGHPVVSFSVGASSMFRIGGISRSAACTDITLKSGDVLIFGGLSRLRYHGIVKILDENHPFIDELNGGRINFTLRKY